MKESWTDFEKWTFEKLEKLDDKVEKIGNRILAIEIKAALWGSLAALMVTLIVEYLR